MGELSGLDDLFISSLIQLFKAPRGYSSSQNKQRGAYTAYVLVGGRMQAKEEDSQVPAGEDGVLLFAL